MIPAHYLKQRQGLPLEAKINMSLHKIREFYDHFQGDVYVSFSGGKDSTVLLDLVRYIYPNVPAVFVDTGLEYPEIREFVKSINNVTWLKPKMPFTQVIEKYGYPVVSKKVARQISDLQNPTVIARDYDTGEKYTLYDRTGGIYNQSLIYENNDDANEDQRYTYGQARENVMKVFEGARNLNSDEKAMNLYN